MERHSIETLSCSQLLTSWSLDVRKLLLHRINNSLNVKKFLVTQ